MLGELWAQIELGKITMEEVSVLLGQLADAVPENERSRVHLARSLYVLNNATAFNQVDAVLKAVVFFGFVRVVSKEEARNEDLFVHVGNYSYVPAVKENPAHCAVVIAAKNAMTRIKAMARDSKAELESNTVMQ